MIDLHTHILPNIDDGAGSTEEALALLQLLKEQGVTTAVLTSHYYGITKSAADFLHAREGAYERVISAYRGDIKLVKGCECNIATCANADLNDLKPLCIEGTQYIVIEMSFENDWSEGLWNRIKKLIDIGLRPIIAHVELYPAVMRKPAYATRLIEMGCLLQLDCQSLWNTSKKCLAKALLQHNQIHCIGSDTHNVTTRPPYYIHAVNEVVTLMGQEYADVLQMNMKKILSNERIAVLLTSPIKKSLFGYV